MKRTYIINGIVALSTAALFSSCGVMSTYQSAKTVGQGNKEITGNYTNYSLSTEDSREYDENPEKYSSIGIQAAYGVTDQFDAGFRFERMSYDGEGTSFLSFSGKYNLVENVLSAYLPLGMYLGEDIDVGETLHIRPTILGNIDLGDNAELTPMIGYYLPFDGDAFKYVQIGIGAGIYLPKVEGLSIRPEMGFSISGQDSGSQRIFHAGIGGVYKF